MNTIAAQLRAKKHQQSAGGFDVDAKRAQKRALMLAIGGDIQEAEQVSLRARYVMWISQSFISRPVAVGVAGVVLVASGLMTTVNAAQESLPGDMLYSVKLINERTQLQLSSLDRRAVLHTEFAERRLREVERLQEDSVTRNSTLVTKTMMAYTQEVASANQNLRELQASGDASTAATANEVDQNLSTLDSSITHSPTPITSPEGSAAVAQAINTTQVAQEDAVTVAVEVHDGQEDAEKSVQDLQEMFVRQYGALAARKEFDVRRVSVIRKAILAQGDALANVEGISTVDLNALERRVLAATENVDDAMDQFAAGGYRSAFDVLQKADAELKAIEAELARIETAIVNAALAPEPQEESSTPTETAPGAEPGA